MAGGVSPQRRGKPPQSRLRRASSPRGEAEGAARRASISDLRIKTDCFHETMGVRNVNRRGVKRRAVGVAEGLLSALERAVEELDAVTVTRKEKVRSDTGEVNTEVQQVLPGETGLIDRGGLKQLTGVLRDMREIFGLQTELESQEQLARIRKLERELETPEDGGLTVTLEGEVEGFAE